MLRNLKAGEEIVPGQWECGAYVTCTAEHSAHISVSFSKLIIIICMGLPPVQYTFVTGGQSTGVDVPPQPNGKHLTYSFTSCAWDCALNQVAVFDRQERFMHLFQQEETSPLRNHTYATSGYMQEGGGERYGDMRWWGGEGKIERNEGFVFFFFPLAPFFKSFYSLVCNGRSFICF